MVTTEIDIAAGYEFYGDGRYTSFLVCPTTYAGIIVKFNGTGGPFSTLRQLAVACLQGGSPGQGIVLTSTANGTLMNDFYVAGFNNVNGGLVLDSTDVFADNFLVENCTTNLYLRGAYCNVTHGELYGGNTGVSMDNSAMTQPGVTTLVSIRCTNNAVTGFSINNSHDLVMEGCSAGYNNNTALSSAGLSISGSSSNINVNNFNGIIGTANSTTSNGIQITGTANNITITDGGCNGFNIGALISTSGTNIQINGGKYNLNNITGVDFNNWTGLVLHINGVQANTNGTIGTPGQGFNGVVHTANQRLVMCGCMAGQLTGAAIQNYGILVDCTQASAKGAITGCATFFNTLGALVITGAQAAQITLTGNV